MRNEARVGDGTLLPSTEKVKQKKATVRFILKSPPNLNPPRRTVTIVWPREMQRADYRPQTQAELDAMNQATAAITRAFQAREGA